MWNIQQSYSLSYLNSVRPYQSDAEARHTAALAEDFKRSLVFTKENQDDIIKCILTHNRVQCYKQDSKLVAKTCPNLVGFQNGGIIGHILM